MQTPYDWITVLIFAALVTHFLGQSTNTHGEDVSLWHYLLASVACAVANWLGNEGHDLAAILLLAGTGYYIFRVFGPRRPLPPKH